MRRKVSPAIVAILCLIAFIAIPLVALSGPPSDWPHGTYSAPGTATTGAPGSVLQQVDFQSSNTLYANSLRMTTSTAARSGLYLNTSSVALSGSTFDATGKYYITLSAASNTTGTYPLNGTLGQRLFIRAANGAGTNTIQFNDNAATMSLGSNRVLTEGNNSIIGLICTTGGARPQWAMDEFQAN